MPIQEGNIKLVASQVMDDVPEGGGAPTDTEIVDGSSNSIFPDISELDRAGGRVSLRKVHLTVQTADRDSYFGSNIIVADPPADPNVSVAVFSTEDSFDRRADARDALESYLIKGTTWGGWLFENHVVGMRTINILAQTNQPLPVIGKTLCLVQDEGLVTQKEQYVRVTSASSVERTFTDGQGDFVRQVITLELSDALRYNFTGHTVQRYDRDYQYTGKTRIRDTTVADATKYYGCSPLKNAVTLGDFEATVESVFTQLVPSAQIETPLINKAISSEIAPMIKTRDTALTYNAAGAEVGPNKKFYVQSGVYPGSLLINLSANTITDNSKGAVLVGGVAHGTIDYTTGEIVFASSCPVSATGTATVTYNPATAAAQYAHTKGIQVTVENRRLNWIETLLPIPAPGSFEFSYMAQGNWYTLRDQGDGTISGDDAAFGAGTVSYVTGSVAVTAGALPDAGSQILMSWGSPAHYEVMVPETPPNGEYVIEAPTITKLIEPGSLTVTWTVGGVTKTATDDGEGRLTGDATGEVAYAVPRIKLKPAQLPDSGTNISVNYDEGADQPAGTNTNPFTKNVGQPLGAGTCGATVTLLFPDGRTYSHLLVDDAFGNLKFSLYYPEYYPLLSHDTAANGVNYSISPGTTPVGSIDYTNGIITVNSSISMVAPTWNHTTGTWDYTPAGTATVQVTSFLYMVAGLPPQDPVTATIPVDSGNAPKIDIGELSLSLMPNSLVFTHGGRTYVDRNGTLYTDIDPKTGSGSVAGTVNYANNSAKVTYLPSGGASSITILAALGRYGSFTTRSANFRTPAAPLKPESLSVSGTTTGGTNLSGTSDPDGNIVGTSVSGAVDYTFGTAQVAFLGDVYPSTIRYNAVAYSYLPLDADVIGVDSVRLPTDGRVPCFRKGDFAVLGNTQTTTPATVSNAQTVTLRERLSRVRVIGNDGNTITTGYSVDLDAGTVTFNDVSGYSQPVRIEHRIEDMMMVSDVQINGDLKFTRPVTHNYPVPGSYVSSALVAGDLKARVSLVFDQATWNGTWSDSLVGSAATGTFNDITYPITVTNAGALTERWVVRFTNTTAFEVIGEHVGLIAIGNTGTDCAPMNPNTSAPYFTIPAAGWGAGWAAGNILRFNTVGAQFPVWVIRTVQQGPETVDDDSFTIIARGDVDKP